MALSTGKKVGIVAVVLLLLAAVWYFFLRAGSKLANKYASAAAQDKAASGKFGTYNEQVPSTDYNAFWGAATIAFGASEYSPGIPNAVAYSQAWFKGMNVAMSAANISEFQSEISAYIASTFKQPHWAVTKGSFRS